MANHETRDVPALLRPDRLHRILPKDLGIKILYEGKDALVE